MANVVGGALSTQRTLCPKRPSCEVDLVRWRDSNLILERDRHLRVAPKPWRDI